MASYIDDILSAKKKENFYEMLGVSEISSPEQILTEYKRKAMELHPDKSDDPTAVDKFQQIQMAKCVLCDPESKKDYDLWLNSGIAMSYETWLNFKSTHRTSMHWVTREKMDPMIEEGKAAKNIEEAQSGDLFSIWKKSDNAVTSELLDRFRKYEI